MGLAASQARFLGLTARKSNVEFQGQQINQQRTALSNRVNNLYDKYNNLDVPTPPSASDYTKTTYNIDSTYEDYEIQNFEKITSGENEGYYNVTLTYDDSVPVVYPYTSRNTRIEATEGENGYSNLVFTIGTDTYTYDENDEENSTLTKITDNYSNYSGLSYVMEQEGKTDGTYYMYEKNGTYYYTSEADLQATAFDETTAEGASIYSGSYTFQYQASKNESKTVSAIAALEQDSSGRISSINFIDCEDDQDLIGNTYSVSVSSDQDEAAYQDAMNQYNYDKQVYENELEKINLETEKIQAEDRSLELKLNQLDTEQRAISTEMESISKVIEDSVDRIFKTFDS